VAVQESLKCFLIPIEAARNQCSILILFNHYRARRERLIRWKS
jgi:hypothetical protein